MSHNATYFTRCWSHNATYFTRCWSHNATYLMLKKPSYSYLQMPVDGRALQYYMKLNYPIYVLCNIRICRLVSQVRLYSHLIMLHRSLYGTRSLLDREYNVSIKCVVVSGFSNILCHFVFALQDYE